MLEERTPAILPIEAFMTEEHLRLDRLLLASERADGSIDDVTYSYFRASLLRHIAMEEKVLLPFARVQNHEPLAIARVLREEHGEIAKLLVRTPTAAIVHDLKVVLFRHDGLEEGPAGLYATCDRLAGSIARAEEIVERLKRQPQVPLAKYYDGPLHRH